MASTFLRDLQRSLPLSAQEAAEFRRAGVRSAEDLHGLMYMWAPDQQSRRRATEILDVIVPMLRPRYRKRLMTRLWRPVAGFGAAIPAGPTLHHPALRFAPDQSTPPTQPGALASEPCIDLRPKNWAVREQRPRATCVAFAAAACCEFQQWHGGQPVPCLSPQFLYWATKTLTGDPAPTEPQTWLAFAKQALAEKGIPPEADCPYDPNQTGPVAGPAPSQAVLDKASTDLVMTTHAAYRPTGAATLLLQCLKNQRPAALSIPIFTSPSLGNDMTNWTQPAAWSLGTILTPLAGWQESGGHCVCVTGFVPDATEPLGGYFIIRNSWSTEFAEDCQDMTGCIVPEPGYGALGATYVEQCCTEILQL